MSDPIRFAIKRGQAYHVSDSGEPTTPVDGNTVRVEDKLIKRLAISVTKRWSDNLDADRYRTPSVTVQLQQDGTRSVMRSRSTAATIGPPPGPNCSPRMAMARPTRTP